MFHCIFFWVVIIFVPLLAAVSIPYSGEIVPLQNCQFWLHWAKVSLECQNILKQKYIAAGLFKMILVTIAVLIKDTARSPEIWEG
tara:strand:- start:1972 stop:2226 length:255 start_codon:yes stop_codon:yes gene_type:complete